MSYKDQIVWITGASSGIGEALVYRFAKQGAILIISARREDELERVKNSCPSPEKVFILQLDLAEPQAFVEKVKQVMDKYGRLDLIVHNAGISQRSLAKDTKVDVDRKLMEINYLGTVALTKEILPYYIKQQAGHFAIVTSLVGKFGSPYRSGYAGSKHALHGFFDSLRAELYRDNIQVTLVCPGFIRTNVSINAFTGDGSKQNTMDEKTDKGLTAEECGRRIVNALAKGKEEVLVGKTEVYAVYLKRFLPGLFSKILSKAKVV
jgi:dehydrogenase/reductase SDR family protein 7B